MENETPTQDGETPQEWLTRQFEFEYCSCCGFDAEDHTVCGGPFDLFFARCDKHPEEIGEEAHRAHHIKVHGSAPEPGSFYA